MFWECSSVWSPYIYLKSTGWKKPNVWISLCPHSDTYLTWFLDQTEQWRNVLERSSSCWDMYFTLEARNKREMRGMCRHLQLLYLLLKPAVRRLQTGESRCVCEWEWKRFSFESIAITQSLTSWVFLLFNRGRRKKKKKKSWVEESKSKCLFLHCFHPQRCLFTAWVQISWLL